MGDEVIDWREKRGVNTRSLLIERQDRERYMVRLYVDIAALYLATPSTEIFCWKTS